MVEPKEGGGAIYPYFKTTKLCDTTTPFSAEAAMYWRQTPEWSARLCLAQPFRADCRACFAASKGAMCLL